MTTLENLAFDNSFSRLPEAFYSRLQPKGFARPFLVSFNPEAAALIDLDPEEAKRDAFAAYFGGQQPLPGSRPLAMKYTGHQFGGYNPDLGDGRGLLLGEVVNQKGERWDLHLKGAGQTPYSRFGDGRAVLRSSIREYLGSEAIHHLGIPTTRALCIVGSDELVYREKTERGAMIVRLADSHIRFGHFEWLFHSQEHALLAQLSDYVLHRHYPEYEGEQRRYELMFGEIVRRTARLMAQWQLVGFAHGVMNTDNFSITGATFDYGPYGFLDAYEPGFICNHSDHNGRYAWNRQPSIGLWNLNALAQAFTPLVEQDALIAALQQYEPTLLETYAEGFRAKLGLKNVRPDDQELNIALLDLLMKNQVDYTRFFRALSHESIANEKSALRDDFLDREGFDAWFGRYRERLQSENSQDAQRQHNMLAANPKYILRNYLAQIAIDKAEDGDYSEIDRLRTLLSKPFDEQPDMESYAALPPDWGRHLEISCSS